MNKYIVFGVSLFLIGFISDVILHIIQKFTSHLSSLKNYWDEYGWILGGLYAALTCVIVGLISLAVTKAVVGEFPLNLKNIFWLIFFSFVFGFLADLFIGEARIFPPLDEWYQQIGRLKSALFGGGAIVICAVISIVIVKFLAKR